MKKTLITLLLAIISVGTILATENLTGKQIMTIVDERNDGDDKKSKMLMTLINKRNRKRIREIKSYSKDYGKDSKKVMVFLKPADVKGTGFLSWEYDDSSRDDDRWLYMPAFRKTRRISGSSNDDYFMGSDFTYDDMGDRSIDEDTHTFVKTENCLEHDCWLVKSEPIDKDDMYTLKETWVSKKHSMAVKVKFYDKQGLIKTLEIKEIKQVNGIYTATKMLMNNHREKHKTLLEFDDITFNQGIEDKLFTVSTIQRGRLK